MRRFNAEVPQIWQWDDHEVVNNWSDAKTLDDDVRYSVKHLPLLIARATQAFFDYAPLRPHGPDEAERIANIVWLTADATFGPQIVFTKAPPTGHFNLSPYAGLQFFGEVNIDKKSRTLTVNLKEIDGDIVFTQMLQAE